MEIRQARRDDKGPIAELMYSAGTHLYDLIYKTKNNTAIDFIRFEYQTGDGFCGFNNVLVAVDDGRVVATGCFYDGVTYKKLMIGAVKNLFKYYGPFNVWPILKRSSHVSSVMKPPKKDELYLSNFGVSEECRGKGVGTKMIQHQLVKAKNDGYRVFSLDVADSNPRAEQLYRRFGLQVVETKIFSGKGDIPKVKKMELAL